MPDSGRVLYKNVRSTDRLLSSKIKQVDSTTDEAITVAADILSGKKLVL